MNPNENQPQQPVEPNQALPTEPSQSQVFNAQPTLQSGQPVYNQSPQVTQPDYSHQPSQPLIDQQPYAIPTAGRGNKGLLIGIVVGVLLLAIAGGLVILLSSHKKTTSGSGINTGSNSSNANTGSSALATSKDACQLFTLSDAQSVIGANAVIAPGLNIPAVKGVSMSQCTYNAATSDGGIDSLIVEIAGPSDGSTSRAANSYKLASKGDKNIPGIGNGASYDSNSQEFTVLKDNVLITANYTDESGAPSQSIDAQVAEAMLNNF